MTKDTSTGKTACSTVVDAGSNPDTINGNLAERLPSIINGAEALLENISNHFSLDILSNPNELHWQRSFPVIP